MRNILITLGLLGIGIGSDRGAVTPPPTLTPYIQPKKIKLKQIQPTLQIKPIKSLVDALIYVESRGNSKAFNQKEDACGCLQIRPIMVREINRILKKQNSDQRFSLEDRWDCGLSKEMFYIWRDYHHSNSSEEVIARNWNGGPRGYKNPKTEPYWKKVKKQWES
jgi:hypothetical protein